ncbi:MAG TPA: pyrrolo-quinoline quinone, partial [Myxococcales bacterium]|nr:pyrrolo-quinoline quinone [Myxococcales bacterium]
MIRIRPGRSWRLNPTYLGELRALTQARARGFNGAEILDVLGIEVDGVDIAAGVGEARVLQAVDELAQALIQLGEGEPAAQATIGPGPTELVLEARGHDLLMTLVTLAPPARILASGLLVDAHKMRTATLHAARGL